MYNILIKFILILEKNRNYENLINSVISGLFSVSILLITCWDLKEIYKRSLIKFTQWLNVDYESVKLGVEELFNNIQNIYKDYVLNGINFLKNQKDIINLKSRKLDIWMPLEISVSNKNAILIIEVVY